MTRTSNQTIIINIILGALALALLFTYLIQQNNTTSKGFEINSLNASLRQINSTYNDLIIQKASLDNIAEIEEFARGKGMIEASQVIYVYESGRVALKKI